MALASITKTPIARLKDLAADQDAFDIETLFATGPLFWARLMMHAVLGENLM